MAVLKRLGYVVAAIALLIMIGCGIAFIATASAVIGVVGFGVLIILLVAKGIKEVLRS